MDKKTMQEMPRALAAKSFYTPTENIMIKSIACIALFLSQVTPVYAAKGEFTSESICLTLGKVAAATADFRKVGASEDDVIKTIEISVPESNPTARRMQRQVAQFVYTMEFDAINARKIVYLKCKAGDFDN
jgi:hypothetical protein